MGLVGMLNNLSGYSEENMEKTFGEILPKINSKALCSVGITLNVRTSLFVFKTKTIAAGFAAITDKDTLIIYTVTPIKSMAVYDINSPEKLIIKNRIANQKSIEYRFLNLYTHEIDDMLLVTRPNIAGFPHQASNLEYFLSILEKHKTK